MNLYAMENITEELGFLPIQKNLHQLKKPLFKYTNRLWIILI